MRRLQCACCHSMPVHWGRTGRNSGAYNNDPMPIYEYICQGCQARFETLVTAERRPSCPACQGQSLEKQLSVFAVSTKSSSSASMPAAGGCGTCGDPRGPGACSLN